MIGCPFPDCYMVNYDEGALMKWDRWNIEKNNLGKVANKCKWVLLFPNIWRCPHRYSRVFSTLPIL